LSVGENIIQHLLDTHTLVPGFRTLFNFTVLCKEFPYDPKTAEALYSILKIITATLPAAHKVTEAQLRQEVHAGFPDHPMTVPLYEVIDTGKVINEILWQFCHQLPSSDTKTRLRENENRYHGVDNVSRRRILIPPPSEVDEPPEDLIRYYLHDTPFYNFFAHTQVPFTIPKKTWSSHGIVLAPSGHGKTQLLSSLVSGFLHDPDSPGFFVLDPHGDLYNTLRCRVPETRLVLLDPDTNPPPLNFLDFGLSTEAATLQTFSYLMSSLSGGLSDKQGAIVPYLLKLLKKIPDASLETLRQIVDEKVKTPQQSKYHEFVSRLPDVDQGFFHNQFYSSRMQETKDAIGWKLYGALSSDAFRQMFAAKHNSLNFDQLIAERKVVVVKGGFDALGEDGMRVFLQFVVAQYYAAGMRRLRLPERERHLNLFICDEASHILTTPIVARMLFDLRKVACGFLGATQVWEQVATDVKAAVLGNTAIKIVGPVQFSDASILSREMYVQPDFIRGMQRHDGEPFAPWAMYVQGMTKKAARVVVPFGVLERMPKLNSHTARTHSTDTATSQTVYANRTNNANSLPHSIPQTHEGPKPKPEPEPSHGFFPETAPAEADTTALSQEAEYGSPDEAKELIKLHLGTPKDEPLTSKKKW